MVEVSEQDVDDVVLRLLPQAQLTIEASNLPVESFHILLVSTADGQTMLKSLAIQEEGTHEVPGLPSGSYRVQMLRRPAWSRDAKTLHE